MNQSNRLLYNRAKVLLRQDKAKTVKDLLYYIGIQPKQELPFIESLDSPASLEILEKAILWKRDREFEQEHKEVDIEAVYAPAIADTLIESSYVPPKPKTRKELIAEYKFPERNPDQKATLKPQQLRIAKEMFYDIVEHNETGLILRLEAGLGKTYVYAQVLRWLFDSGWIKEHSVAPSPIFVVTPLSVQEQTRRVLCIEFGLKELREVLFTTYSALRSSFGDLYIEKTPRHERGVLVEDWKFRPFVHPVGFVWDESQHGKNTNSKQSKVMRAANFIEDHIFQIFSSATPASRVSACEHFCCATKRQVPVSWSGREEVLTPTNWNSFASRIATRGDPKIYSRASMERIVKIFKPNFYSVKGLYPEFDAINSVELLDFENERDAEHYAKLWETYLRNCKKLGQNKRYGFMLFLAQITILRAGAEPIRAGRIARDCYQVLNSGKSFVAACAYKPTIAKIVNYLVNDYNIPRDEISLIWGGLPIPSEFLSRDDMMEVLSKMIEDQNINKKVVKAIEYQLKLQSADIYDLDPSLELGIQTREERQNEIDKFQEGKSRVCLFTFKAGGEGLSLHHHNDKTTEREVELTPVYNEMEMHQAMKRVPRLTSLSHTRQRILLFKNTIELEVLKRQNLKKFSLEVVTSFEGGSDAREAGKIVNALASDEFKHEDELLDIHKRIEEDEE